jgi:hypothetical protein
MSLRSPSILARLFGSDAKQTGDGRAPPVDPPAATDSSVATASAPTLGSSVQVPAPPAYRAASTIDDIIRVEEVTAAEFFIGDLFRRRFGGDPPSYPRGFVAFYKPDDFNLQSVGFVHFMAFEDSYLCGGLVKDDQRYRQMPTEHTNVIRAAGGIAEKLLRATFARLADSPAIWAHVGNPLAERVLLRVGFQHTEDQHIMVYWNKDLPAEEKAQRFARVVALGSF